ncbi:hypothetical protein ACFL57_01950 [Candidatus Margulisiibacteriota bacterium]
MDVKYHEIYQSEKNHEWLREKLVKYALKHGQRAAARHFECSINTVKLWLSRKDGPEETRYKDRSKAAKTIHNRTSPDIEQLVLKCRERENMGGHNLTPQYNLPVAGITAYRIIKRHGKIKPRKKKYKQTKDLRKIKAKQKCFETVQVDGKVLNDIVNFWPYYSKYFLPLWQFTFTCEKSGATFYAYCKGETALAACTFIVYVIEHLKRYGIKVKKIKTDKGSFAVGRRSLKHTNFQKLLKLYGIKHQAIEHKNQNADVERFHGLIEQYFYSICHIESKADFYRQATDKQIWFNYIRKNKGKDWHTALEILKTDYPNTDPQVLALRPIDLDKHVDMYFYKIDPDHKPLTFEDFFIDVPEEKLNDIKSFLNGQVYQYALKLDVSDLYNNGIYRDIYRYINMKHKMVLYGDIVKSNLLPMFYDEVSVNNFIDFLNMPPCMDKEITVLWETAKNLLLVSSGKKLSHAGLAAKYNNLIKGCDKSTSRWYGFRCQNPARDILLVQPSSDLYGGIPISISEHFSVLLDVIIGPYFSKQHIIEQLYCQYL